MVKLKHIVPLYIKNLLVNKKYHWLICDISWRKKTVKTNINPIIYS
jgi:hypothetical protein